LAEVTARVAPPRRLRYASPTAWQTPSPSLSGDPPISRRRTIPMDDKELEEKIRAMSFSSGKNTMSLDDMATIQPGLARIMPEIGARTWKLYYAAKAENWPMAKFQYKEIIGLFELGAFMRPKHEAALNQYMEENWKPLADAIAAKDFAAFEKAYHASIEA